MKLKNTPHRQSGLLSRTSIASASPAPGRCFVYFQDCHAGIHQSSLGGVWSTTNSAIFRAKTFTPLATICWEGGNEIRVYCLSHEDFLQEWCYSSCDAEKGWYPGELTDLKVRAASDTSIAAVQWDNGRNIRVFCQESTSDTIQEFCLGKPWTRGAVLPVAQTGSSIAVASWWHDGICLRVYYQAPDLTLREHCLDFFDANVWFPGEFTTGKVPPRSSISALAWNDSQCHLRVYCQDRQLNIVGYESEDSWKSSGLVLESLPRDTKLSAVRWSEGHKIRLYYQSANGNILEGCQNGGAWFNGSTVATSI